MCFSNPADPTDEAIDCYFTPLVSSPRRKALVHAYAMALEHNPLEGIGPALRKCNVPTRIVWGMDDTIFSPAGAAYLDRTFAHSLGIRRVANASCSIPKNGRISLRKRARKLWVTV